MRTLKILALVAALAAASFGQNLKLDEIIAKHRASRGKAEVRQQVNTYFVTGLSEFGAKLPAIKGVGKVVMVSNADNYLFLMGLNSKEYPYEKIGYFDGKINLPFVTAGTRSPLGAFIADHKSVLDNGLFGGTTTKRWILDAERPSGKLIASGTKKIDGRKVYVIDFFPGDGASTEYTTRICIDAETFDHVRTEYRHEIAPKQDTFGTLGRQAGALLTLTENFGDYREVEGHRLPFSYSIVFSSSSQSGQYEYTWAIRVAEYRLNQKLAPDFFTFDPK